MGEAYKILGYRVEETLSEEGGNLIFRASSVDGEKVILKTPQKFIWVEKPLEVPLFIGGDSTSLSPKLTKFP